MNEPVEGIELPNPVVCAGHAYSAIQSGEIKQAQAWAQLGQLIATLPHAIAAERVAQAAVQLVATPRDPELVIALEAAVADYLLT